MELAEDFCTHPFCWQNSSRWRLWRFRRWFWPWRLECGRLHSNLPVVVPVCCPCCVAFVWASCPFVLLRPGIVRLYVLYYNVNLVVISILCVVRIIYWSREWYVRTLGFPEREGLTEWYQSLGWTVGDPRMAKPSLTSLQKDLRKLYSSMLLPSISACQIWGIFRKVFPKLNPL